MRIRDLSRPVVAAKSDYLGATTWIGFTPSGTGHDAVEKCRSTIARQAAGGYVLEYITQNFGVPNPGAEHDPHFLKDKADHAKVAGRLVAVHRLRPTARSLREIVGEKEFNWLQDVWSQDGNRDRWSVAFPVIESFSIEPAPLASEVLRTEGMKRLFAHPAATLRPMIESEVEAIANLTIEARPSSSAWIAIEDEVRMAELSPPPSRSLVSALERDLSAGAFEGMTEEEVRKTKLRAAWLANRFVLWRRKENTLHCDDCGFDPKAKVAGTAVNPRSLLDVHHKDPIAEGKRYTTIADFSLLCPICHRFIHATLSTAAGSTPATTKAPAA